MPNDPAAAEAAAYKLSGSLAALDLPSWEQFPVDGPPSLLRAFVAGCDPRGRYYASPPLLKRLFWWQWPTADEAVATWRDELVTWGDLDIRAGGMNCYSPGAPFDVAYLVDPRRFRRFRARRPIPDDVHPWSRGGEDVPTNLQTMCQPCNSTKGARVL